MLTPAEFESMIKHHIPTDFQRTIAVNGFIKFKEESLARISRNMPPLNPEELPRFVERSASEYQARDDTRQNTIERIRTFLRNYPIFGEGIDWRNIIVNQRTKLINIIFGTADENTIRFGIGCILKELWECRRRNQIPPLVVSFEEAHMIVPRGDLNVASFIVKKLLRYGRHYGIGVIMITQRPSSVDPETIGMPATRVIFALDHYLSLIHI